MAKVLIVGLLLFAGCATQRELRSLHIEVDLSPVDCGYKWFQSGYSPNVYMECGLRRDHLGVKEIAKASENAWSIAATRCPSSCPPRELKDTVDWVNPSPEGVCRDGVVYFHNRLFFQCGM